MKTNIFKENLVKCINDKKFQLTEDQIKQNNFEMTLNISIKKSEKNLGMYQLVEPKDEHSKIKFLYYNEFPDGVFIKKTAEDEYKIYIIEMKRDITKYLDKIPKQLHSGVLHAISIIKMTESNLELDSNTIINLNNLKLSFELFVCSGKKITFSTPKKVIPGKPVESNTRLKTLINKKQVYHNLKQKEMVVLPVQVLNCEKNINDLGNEIYTSDLILD